MDKMNFIRDAIAAVRRGIDLDDWLERKMIEYAENEDFNEMLEREGITEDDFWEEIEDTVNQQQGHEPQYEKEKKKTEQEINRWLMMFKVRGRVKEPKYSELHKWRGRALSRIEVNNKKIQDKTMEEIEKELEGILASMQKYEMEYQDVLSDIWDRNAVKLVGGRDEEQDETINMMLNDFYAEVGKLNLMLASDRLKFYVFWEKIHDKYEELVDAVDKFKKLALKARSIDAETKEMLKQLEVPDQYIEQFDHVTLKDVPGPFTRIMALLESLGGKRPKVTQYERENIRTTGEGAEGDFLGVKRPVLSQRKPDLLPGEKEKAPISSEWMAEGLGRPADIEVVDLELDPILLWNLKREFYELGNIGMGEDYETIINQLRWVKSQMPEGNVKQLIDAVLEETKDAVSDIPEDVIYLPLTDWLKEVDKTVIDRMDKIEKETGKFFSILNRLLLTSGQFPVHIDTRFGGPKKGTAGSSVTVAGKSHPDPKGFRQEREQGGEFELPEEKDLGVSKAIEDAIKDLKKALNDYYFHPMSSNYFVDDEKPDFVDEGGLDFGDKLDPDALTREGRMPYRALEFRFGTIPKVSATKNIMEGLDEDSAFDIDLLSEILEFLKKTTRGFDLEGGWEAYKKELEQLIELLDVLFPDHEEENRIWAAGKLGEVLINHQQKLDKAKLFGKPLRPLYNKYLKYMQDPTKQLPMAQLRQIFEDPIFLNEFRAEIDYRGESGKEWAREMQEVMEQIVRITDPEEDETAKDKIQQDKARLQKAILTVHDYIRKINNQQVYYGTLDVDDVSDMDYLITKIENEDKIELNTIEIINMVNSIDSHNNISKSFGVSELVVYKVKGLCR